MSKDERFDVFHRSGTGSVHLVRGADRARAVAMAQDVANKQRHSVFVESQASKRVEEFAPQS